MTTIAPPPLSPDTPHFDVSEPTRLVRVCANLMPEEIINARAVRVVQRRLGFAIVVLVALLLAWYAYSKQQTSAAEDDLANARQQATDLQSQAARFQPLQAAQGQAAQIQQTLTTIMGNDLQWSDLIHKLDAAAGRGVLINALNATIGSPTGSAPSASANPLAAPGVTVVGTLSISGTAPDSSAVGRFVNSLSAVKGLADPVPTSMTGQRGAYTFSINVSLTTQALGGRFSPTTAPVTPTSAATAGASATNGSGR